MRYFQRALRRADVKMRYSEGFNPHPIMSFAAPLGVGLTSDGEYVDIEVLESDPSEEMIRQINEVLPDEFRILSFRKLPDDTPKAMAQAAAADYTLSFYPDKLPSDPALFANGAETFLQRQEITVLKESKRGVRSVDIRPMIFGFETGRDMTVRMKVAMGSAANLKPETLMDAYMESLGLALKPVSLLINRDEMYAEGKGRERFVSLEKFGEEI